VRRALSAVRPTGGALALLLGTVAVIAACGQAPTSTVPTATTVDLSVGNVGTVVWQYSYVGGATVWGPYSAAGVSAVGSPDLPDVGDLVDGSTLYTFRAFVGFRLRGAGDGPTIPAGSRIENASLVLYQGSLAGNPFSRGPTVVSQVDYLDDGSLRADDFFQVSLAGPAMISTTAIIGSRTVDVTGLVAGAQVREPRDPASHLDWASQTVYVGLRLEWAVTNPASPDAINTDGDGESDWVEYRPVVLRVTYR
jgi:hypothetical protein